jgi:hypothetical protein
MSLPIAGPGHVGLHGALAVLEAKSGALPVDAQAMAIAVLVLIGSGTIAVLLPARRASLVAPGVAHKAE